MSTQTSYQRLIGWVFMVIFLFITTPVHVWHHHTPVDQVYAAETTIHTSTPSAHGHCDVCEHQYTVFLHEAADWQLVNPPIFTVLFVTPVFVIPHAFLGQDANKGPPANV